MLIYKRYHFGCLTLILYSPIPHWLKMMNFELYAFQKHSSCMVWIWQMEEGVEGGREGLTYSCILTRLISWNASLPIHPFFFLLTETRNGKRFGRKVYQALTTNASVCRGNKKCHLFYVSIFKLFNWSLRTMSHLNIHGLNRHISSFTKDINWGRICPPILWTFESVLISCYVSTFSKV